MANYVFRRPFDYSIQVRPQVVFSVAASEVAAAGQATGDSIAYGNLAGTGALTGISFSASVAYGNLAGEGALTGISFSTSVDQGNLSVTADVAGMSFSNSTASGNLGGVGSINGFSAGQAVDFASLLGSGSLAGLSSGSPTSKGNLLAAGSLSGISAGISFEYGNLSSVAATALYGRTYSQSVVYASLLANGKLVGRSYGYARVNLSTDSPFAWTLEAYISSAWVSISEDVLCHDHPVIASRGIEGYSVTDRVASAGSLTAMLDNSKSNSAALLGYYSPDHANMRAGFGLDTFIRLKFVYGRTTKYVWRGYVADLQPTPGQFKRSKSFLSATDFMQRLAEHKLKAIPVQIDQRPDQVVDTILTNMETVPVISSLALDPLNLPLSLNSEQDEKSTAMSALQKLCQSALSYAFVIGNATDGETFVYQREVERATSAVEATLDDTMSDLKTTRNTDRKKNKVIGSIFPARADTGADTLVATLANELMIEAGDTQTISLRMRDPSGGASRISAINIVTSLSADTHYKMSSVSGNQGNDMNASLGVVVAAGGNTVEVELTNNGAVRGFVNKVDIYGDGIYVYDPVDIAVESGLADKTMKFEMPYLNDYYKGRDFTTAVHRRTSPDLTDVESVGFYADANSTLMGYAMSIDIGDRVELIESATGVSNEFIVNKVTYTIQTNGLLRVDWGVEIANTYDFFTLDHLTLGVLDDTDNVLSPY